MTTQELLNITFQLIFTIAKDKKLSKKTNEEIAIWVRDQLAKCGLETEPMGANWGVIKK